MMGNLKVQFTKKKNSFDYYIKRLDWCGKSINFQVVLPVNVVNCHLTMYKKKKNPETKENL